MSAREVNLFTSKWKATGEKVAVPQYEISLRLDWTGSIGTKSSRTETVRFPDLLKNIPSERLQEIITDILVEELRTRLEVDK